MIALVNKNGFGGKTSMYQKGDAQESSKETKLMEI